MMEDTDRIWAQTVVNRWAAEQGMLTARVRMTPRMREEKLTRYRDNIVLMYRRAWCEDDFHSMLESSPLSSATCPHRILGWT